GVKLSKWLEGFDSVGSANFCLGPTEAVRAIGTNCVPFLLRQIRSRDFPQRQRSMDLLGYDSFKYRHSSARSRQWTAAWGFWVLGTRAEFAIPELAELATDPAYSFGATWSLSGMKSAKAVPVL